jgi:hypothetical protein
MLAAVFLVGETCADGGCDDTCAPGCASHIGHWVVPKGSSEMVVAATLTGHGQLVGAAADNTLSGFVQKRLTLPGVGDDLGC